MLVVGLGLGSLEQHDELLSQLQFVVHGGEGHRPPEDVGCDDDEDGDNRHGVVALQEGVVLGGLDGLELLLQTHHDGLEQPVVEGDCVGREVLSSLSRAASKGTEEVQLPAQLTSILLSSPTRPPR